MHTPQAAAKPAARPTFPVVTDMPTAPVTKIASKFKFHIWKQSVPIWVTQISHWKGVCMTSEPSNWRVGMIVPLAGGAGIFGPSCQAVAELVRRS